MTKRQPKYHSFDAIVIGTGAAGLGLALRLSEHCQVAVLCKDAISEGSTLYAQGGVAVVTAVEDSIDAHVADTIGVGKGLCDPEVVRFAVENGPDCMNWIINKGAQFTREKSKRGNAPYHLHKEGGHSFRRVIHAADYTGKEVEVTLVDVARNSKNIKIFEYHTAIDLITQRGRCRGVYVYDDKRNKIDVFAAKAIVLASGGASRVYLYSSNPEVSSGDGIAMAWRAGATICNMEFNQFHPTCLYNPKHRNFLITEAMRGEGAKLLLPDGTRFMPKFDKRAEMAPRDVVAKAIDFEMKRLGIKHVLLDISHKKSSHIKMHFPTIYKRCKEYGFDITKEPIPVVPAAHYSCGGVKADINGRTTIPGLYAVGEVAYTGLHGANRMASNSLLECLVFPKSVCKDIVDTLPSLKISDKLKAWDESWVTDSNDEVFVTHNWQEVKHFMWDYVGIVRSNKRLERAARRIAILKKEIAEYYGNFRITRNLIELRNLIVVADLIVKSARRRKESRGLHYTLDYPKPDDKFLKPTCLTKKAGIK